MIPNSLPDSNIPPPTLNQLSSEPEKTGARIRWWVKGNEVRTILRVNGVDTIQGGPRGDLHLPDCGTDDELELVAWDHRNRMVTASFRVGDPPLVEE